MKLICSTIALVMIMAATSCKKDKNDRFTNADFDALPADTYYPSDVINAAHENIYGSWIVYGTSGGFAGQGYTADFHKLLLKPNGIFGIVRNDSLLTYGKIVVNSQTMDELFVSFVPETALNIDIINDNEKFLSLRAADSLDLVAPCCDRFSTHLRRE